jgi:hypothetical protein
VEGDIDAAGVLIASKVEIKASGFIRIESIVEAVQADQLTVLGIVVAVNMSTRYEDKSTANVDLFDLADVSAGDFIAIRGFEDSGGVVATMLEREDYTVGDPVTLRGFVDGVGPTAFTVLGATVLTSVATEFDNLAGAPISSAEFFAQAMGQLVEAVGTLNGSTVVAAEVSFDD